MNSPISIDVLSGLAEVSSADWNRGVDVSDPFTDHAFLALLEESGCVGPEAGWVPVHLLARSGSEVVGRAPLYLKNNSYGEYIFDWGWAESAHRAGLPYYPKLVSAVPFTPATGRRLLAEHSSIRAALVEGMLSVMEATRAHSLHVLFALQEERRELEGHAALLGRSTHQFHWHNDGYESFDHWLSMLRSRHRKTARRERRAPDDCGVRVERWRGESLTEERWRALHGLYLDTIDRKYAHPYLTPAFFELAPHRVAHSALVFAALQGEDLVAAALCFQRGQHLYGRYWGCRPGFKSLHFELCYHAPIACCIDEGWTHFEAGAQGIHKLKRGLRPAMTHSLHHLRDTRLHHAVARALREENARTDWEIAELNKASPFRAERHGPS